MVVVLLSAAGGSSADAATWIWSQPVNVDPGGGGLTGISCPSARFCVAVDEAGRVVTSRSPMRRSTAWSISAPITQGPLALESVTCPTDRVCLSLEELGSTAFVSTDPAGGAGAWRPDAIGGDAYFGGLACPSATLCVAVDSSVGDGGGTRILTTH
jgi:hypothetical protein